MKTAAVSPYAFSLAWLVLLSPICLAQNLISPDTASPDTAIGAADFGAAVAGEPSGSGAPSTDDPQASTPAQPDPNKLKIVVYPIEGIAPIFGASFRLPDTPSTPGGGSGKTDTSLNGAALFGVTIQKSKWYGDFSFEYAGLSASRSNPHVGFDVDAKFASGLIGFDIWKHLYVTGGFRYLGLPYNIRLGNFGNFHRTPEVTDPLVGLMWNQQVSKKWTLNLNAQGGGFGVGCEEDISLIGKADWQFAKHFGLMFGYGGLHFEISDTKLGKTLKVNQTLSGPTFGFGIYF